MSEYAILKDPEGNKLKVEMPTTPNPIVIAENTDNKNDILIIISQSLLLLVLIVGVIFSFF